MKNNYYKIMFSIFFSALAICGALRILMRFVFIDSETGFFIPVTGAISIAFYAVSGASIVAMLLLNRFRHGHNDYHVRIRGGFTSAFRIVVGLSILAFTWFGLPSSFGQAALFGEGWELMINVINHALGTLSGLSFIISGFTGLFSDRVPNNFMMIIPAIWQIILLLSRFNGYYSILYVSDNLIIVLFMVFATMFYMGHARTVCGIGRRDGRNYVISAGLSASLCGLLSSSSNIMYMFSTGADIPADISSWECFYTLALGLYALSFVMSYARSMEQV